MTRQKKKSRVLTATAIVVTLSSLSTLAVASPRQAIFAQTAVTAPLEAPTVPPAPTVARANATTHTTKLTTKKAKASRTTKKRAGKVAVTTKRAKTATVAATPKRKSWTATVYGSGKAGLAVRTSPTSKGTLIGRLAEGSSFTYTCQLTGGVISDPITARSSKLWLRGLGGYLTVVYTTTYATLTTASFAAVPKCNTSAASATTSASNGTSSGTASTHAASDTAVQATTIPVEAKQTVKTA